MTRGGRCHQRQAVRFTLEHRQAVVMRANTAEAFEDANALDKLEGFASLHGPDFYGLPRNAGTLTLTRSQWQLPAEVPFGEQTLVPLRGGEMLRWKSV